MVFSERHDLLGVLLHNKMLHSGNCGHDGGYSSGVEGSARCYLFQLNTLGCFSVSLIVEKAVPVPAWFLSGEPGVPVKKKISNILNPSHTK